MASYEQRVRGAKSPQEAMALLARALDEVIGSGLADPWAEWTTPRILEAADAEAQLVDFVSTEGVVTHAGVQITGDTEHTDVVIPAPSLEKQRARREFESAHLHLTEHLGEGDWSDAYAKGGPMWLYLGNRALVMSLPGTTKQAMIMDVEEESPKDAHEMGRDLLKADCADGPGGGGMMPLASGEVG